MLSLARPGATNRRAAPPLGVPPSCARGGGGQARRPTSGPRPRYDNLRAAVAQVLGFSRPGSSLLPARNPRGTREGRGRGPDWLVRRTYIVPVPEVATLAEFNAVIEQWDEADDVRRIRSRHPCGRHRGHRCLPPRPWHPAGEVNEPTRGHKPMIAPGIGHGGLPDRSSVTPPWLSLGKPSPAAGKPASTGLPGACDPQVNLPVRHGR